MKTGRVFGVVGMVAALAGGVGCGEPVETEQATAAQYRYHDGLGHEFVLSDKFDGTYTGPMAEGAAKAAEAAFAKEMRVERGYQPVYHEGETQTPENLVMGCIILKDIAFTGGVTTERCWTTSHVRQEQIDAGVKPGYVLKNRVADVAYGPVTVPKEE